jgi:DNA-binding PadR family transcriptional regulator
MSGSLAGELAAFKARVRESGLVKGAGRARKVYGITDAGRARLGLLERRRAHLVERLAKARAAIRNRRERLDDYSRSLMEHGNEATERDISWLDRLIERERTNGASPDTTTEAPSA